MGSRAVRAIIVVAIGALLAFQVVRTAAVRGAVRNGTSTALWATHPVLQLQHVMAEMGARSAKGETLPPALLVEVDRIARAMPLAPEPFLIKGALAQTAARERDAERLYLEARWRDPRSRAARYLLAERYLRSGRIADGLAEMAVFSTLAGGKGELAPALAAYARTPGAVAELKRLFRLKPMLEEPVLTELAGDAANADLVLALRSPRLSGASLPAPRWEAKLIGSLIEHGEFDRAHRTWAMLAGVPEANRGLFNPEFKKVSAPAPFNWSFATEGGVAEPLNDGRLQLIYFGRDDAVLAEQVLVLEPGSYGLALDVAGQIKDSTLAWSVDCLPSQSNLLRLPVAQSGPLGGRFNVPAQGCVAQRLRLSGTASDFASSTEFTVGQLKLMKGNGG